MIERVRDVMYSYVVNIHGITKVSDALNIMKDENIQTVLVRPRNDEDVYGLITLRDIATKIIAAGSPDVDIHDQEQTIWGIFTRFDAERDIMFTEEKLVGISPVFRGKMGIDATWKKGYPSPLVMSDEISKKVDERWDSYWK